MLCLTGCTQTAQIYTAQHNYYQRRYDDAARRLELGDIPKRDRLLALLERGMALQAAGRYAESAAAWREAEVLMEEQDIFRMGEQALSLLIDQNVLAYQPAPYEKPFLHALLCLDYLILQDIPSARVEALKALSDLDRREAMVGPIAFVRYVAALAYEASGDADDATIEYKKIMGETELARMRAAREAAPEIPVIVFLGKSPRKVASEIDLDEDYKIVLPVFQAQSNALRGARLFAGSNELQDAATTVTSVEKLAATYSGRLFAGELLKEVLRRKAKKHLLKKVGDKVGSTTGELLKSVFFFTLEPDLRTWSSLPAVVHVLRAPAGGAEGLEVRYTGEPPDRAADTLVISNTTSRAPVLLRAW